MVDNHATCAFCNYESYVIDFCTDHEFAKGCARFKEKMETASIGQSLKDMVTHIEWKLSYSNSILERERAERARILCDQIDVAVRDLDAKMEEVKNATSSAPSPGAGGQSFAAVVCDIHDGCLLNLMVIAKNGYPHARVNIPLMQGEGVVDERVAYAHLC